MDITLLHKPVYSDVFPGVKSFNPCFNGYYTSTRRGRNKYFRYRKVSILVLMDITLLHRQDYYTLSGGQCFNPCFNGYYTST